MVGSPAGEVLWVLRNRVSGVRTNGVITRTLTVGNCPLSSCSPILLCEFLQAGQGLVLQQTPNIRTASTTLSQLVCTSLEVIPDRPCKFQVLPYLLNEIECRVTPSECVSRTL